MKVVKTEIVVDFRSNKSTPSSVTINGSDVDIVQNYKYLDPLPLEAEVLWNLMEPDSTNIISLLWRAPSSLVWCDGGQPSK